MFVSFICVHTSGRERHSLPTETWLSQTQLTLPESGSSQQKQRCTIISCCPSEAKSSLWQESGSLIPARIVHSCRLFIPFHKGFSIRIRRSSWRIAGSIWDNSRAPAPVTGFKYPRTHPLGQQVCLSKHSLVFCQEVNAVIAHLIQEGLPHLQLVGSQTGATHLTFPLGKNTLGEH